MVEGLVAISRIRRAVQRVLKDARHKEQEIPKFRESYDKIKENPKNLYSFTSKLSEPEKEGLEREFGWTPHGVGDAGAALMNNVTTLGRWDLLAAEDAATAEREAWNLDIPACRPGVDYDPAAKPHNDCRDAYRHPLWVALMAQRNPAAARRQADAHERTSPNDFHEHIMDLWGNREALRVVSELPKGADPRPALQKSMENARLLRNITETLPIANRLLQTGVRTTPKKDRLPSVSERIDALRW